MTFRSRRLPIVRALEQAALPLAIISLWEIGERQGWISKFFFSSPSEIAAVVGGWFAQGMVFENLFMTLVEAGIGYILGTSIGTVLGLLFAFMPRVAAVFEPFMVMGNSFPRLTLAPLLIVWFGFGMEPKIILVALFTLFICFFNTYKGIQEVDEELLARARMWGASKLQLAQTIYLPATMSWIVTGLRASVGFAIVAAVIGEYMGGDSGVGFLILQGQLRLRMREVLAGLALLLFIAIFVDAFLRLVERRFLAWRPEDSSDGPMPG
jgi:NitT/TauT family transport system permease protein